MGPVPHHMNGHLATGAATICYDGSPMWPDVRRLIMVLAKFKCVFPSRPLCTPYIPRLCPCWNLSHLLLRRVTYFGTSPRYLLELQRPSISPVHEHQFAGLLSLRMVNTTGTTLSPAQYRYFYMHFPARVHLSNSAGGTDTATSLIAADPAGPLRVGEMQVLQALGIDVD